MPEPVTGHHFDGLRPDRELLAGPAPLAARPRSHAALCAWVGDCACLGWLIIQIRIVNLQTILAAPSRVLDANVAWRLLCLE